MNLNQNVEACRILVNIKMSLLIIKVYVPYTVHDIDSRDSNVPKQLNYNCNNRTRYAFHRCGVDVSSIL